MPASRTHCKRGHELTEDNVYYAIENGRRRRRCKQCELNRRQTDRAKAVKKAGRPPYDPSKYQKWYAANAEVAKQRQRDARKNNPDQFRGYEYKKRFGITLEEYNKMLADQNNRCKACKTDEPGGKYNRFMVDHDHSCCPGRKCCGKCIRGLLCHSCNLTLGNALDNPKRLANLAKYIRDFRAPSQ